jgi:hypothetical protein
MKYRMKSIFRLFVLAIISIAFCQTAQAENKESDKSLITFLEEYEGQEGVEIVNLKGLLLNFAKPALKDTPMKNVTDNIKAMTVFSYTEINDAQKKQFIKDISPVLAGYEKALEKKENKTESTIYLKRKDDAVISDMVVYALGEKAVILVVIKGEIPVSELEETPAPEQK